MQILNDKPFWNSKCLNISKNLWTPLNNNLLIRQSFSTYWMNGFKNTFIDNSLYYLYDNINDSDKNQSDGYISINVKINDSGQNKLLKWFGTFRYIHNKSIKLLNDDPKIKKNVTTLRKLLLVKKNNWEIETPIDIRYEAIKNSVKTHKSNLMCKKNKEQYITFKSSHVKIVEKTYKKNKSVKIYIYRKLLKEPFIVDQIDIKKWFNNSSIDHRTHTLLDQWDQQKSIKLLHNIKTDNCTLIFPTKKNIIKNKPITNKSIIALDPGVRTFYTGYSDKEIIYFCGDQEEINILCYKIYTSQIKNNNKKLKNILTEQLNNYVDNLHWKTIDYLINNYSTIILPNFDCQKYKNDTKETLTERIKTQPYDKIKYFICDYKHNDFLQRLKIKCEEYDTNLKFVTEEFTSKTCSSCGCIKNNLGSSKIYKCKKCKIIIDRDVNAAKNIMIKKLCEDNIKAKIKLSKLPKLKIVN